MTMTENGYRHSCAYTDQLYGVAIAAIFFDAEDGRWVLVRVDRENWEAWDFAVTVAKYLAENPLRFRSVGAYDVFQTMGVAFCPWCGLELAKDPAFARWQQVLTGARQGEHHDR